MVPVVVSALELLDVQPSGVGYLNGALGVGGLLGGFVALVLATRGRLAADFGLGLALFGLPLILIGATSSVPVALGALALVGLGNSIVDINALTIMQRAVPNDVLARALGVLEGVLIGALGVGGLLAPVLIHLAGIRWALILTGLLLPVLALAAPAVPPIDRPSHACPPGPPGASPVHRAARGPPRGNARIPSGLAQRAPHSRLARRSCVRARRVTGTT